MKDVCDDEVSAEIPPPPLKYFYGILMPLGKAIASLSLCLSLPPYMHMHTWTLSLPDLKIVQELKL